jgi:hypothetical protein
MIISGLKPREVAALSFFKQSHFVGTTTGPVVGFSPAIAIVVRIKNVARKNPRINFLVIFITSM